MMDKLIAELEQATEGSRELDGPIFRFYIMPDTDWETNKELWWPCEVTFCERFNVPEFTSSLDAKLPGENIAMVIAPTRPDSDWVVWHFIERNDDDLRPRVVIARANTEPLARRAAALKARQATEEAA